MENTVAFTLRRPNILERRQALMNPATEKLFKPVCPTDDVTVATASVSEHRPQC